MALGRWTAWRAGCSSELRRSSSMLDILLVAAAVAFFLVSVAYVQGCDRL